MFCSSTTVTCAQPALPPAFHLGSHHLHGPAETEEDQQSWLGDGPGLKVRAEQRLRRALLYVCRSTACPRLNVSCCIYCSYSVLYFALPGDVSAWSTGSFGQQELSCPARGTASRSSTAHARNALPTSSMRAGDAPASRGKPRKAFGNEGRPRNRDTGEPVGGITPHVRPAQSCHSEGFTSSTIRASPTQPRYHLSSFRPALRGQWCWRSKLCSVRSRGIHTLRSGVL